MKLKKAPIAMALAGGLLLGGATLATSDMITYYLVEPVVVQEVAWVELEPVSDSYYILESQPSRLAGFEVIEPGSFRYYLTTSMNLLPNPVPPSETNSWGG